MARFSAVGPRTALSLRASAAFATANASVTEISSFAVAPGLVALEWSPIRNCVHSSGRRFGFRVQ
ncbi:hypothetical protein [Natrialba swarupiae]|uniref:Uncharacterized protein n=1 Tax=Natrialba swarupiae TaxID=2448032 RepID=A0A5D5AI28_9EURY|nr:hypothetical protein [Natrialba swarupiae]TYT60583.1 hypothetical protein FYC77_18110 [Natrialba swarupiae]